MSTLRRLWRLVRWRVRRVRDKEAPGPGELTALDADLVRLLRSFRG